MMSDIWFALKMLALTIVVVVVMQIHVGSNSIEDRAYVFIQSSSVTSYLQKVADGGVKLASNTYNKIVTSLQNHKAPEAKHRHRGNQG